MTEHCVFCWECRTWHFKASGAACIRVRHYDHIDRKRRTIAAIEARDEYTDCERRIAEIMGDRD